MEELRAAARRKKTPAQPPVKVVYVSSPVRVTATPAEFRDLVQKLTGRGGSSGSYVTAAADDEVGSAGSSSEGESGGFCSPAARLVRFRGCDVETENSLVAPVEVFDEAAAAAFGAEKWEDFSSFMSFYPLH